MLRCALAGSRIGYRCDLTATPAYIAQRHILLGVREGALDCFHVGARLLCLSRPACARIHAPYFIGNAGSPRDLSEPFAVARLPYRQPMFAFDDRPIPFLMGDGIEQREQEAVAGEIEFCRRAVL